MGFLTMQANAQLLIDVPVSWPTRADVQSVVQAGVMDAPGGKFYGKRPLTRVELAITLQHLAESIRQLKWNSKHNVPLKHSDVLNKNDAQTVTRYDMASFCCNMARYTVAVLPAKPDDNGGKSEALETVKLPVKMKNSPAWAALSYLSRNRMLAPQSPLLVNSTTPVTAKLATESMAAMIIGLVDLYTDEPQNRETHKITPKN